MSKLGSSTRWLVRAAGILVLVQAAGCCSAPLDVIVVDQVGRPISGAAVTCASLSIGGALVLTGDNGGAVLPDLVQTVEWISVEKSGFEARDRIAVRGAPRPVCVVLQVARE